MISVVLANYNGEEFLPEALESVFAQDYSDFEVIVVDDGSTDGSRGVIEGFAERYPKRMRPLFMPENKGQAEGFNAGVAASQGDLVCFMDSDDLWRPDKLSRLAAFRADFGPAALYQHNLYLLREGNATEERMRAVMISGDYFDHTRRMKRWPIFVATSGLAFPRAILEKVLPIPRVFRTCADGYLTRTAFCHGLVASTYDAWGYYRVHPGNNVFENPQHDALAYQHGILIPALNEYYGGAGIDFHFSTLRLPMTSAKGKSARAGNRAVWLATKLLNVSIMDVIRKFGAPRGD